MNQCNTVTKAGFPCKNGKNCHLHGVEDPQVCSICLEIVRKTKGTIHLRCNHRFHVKCIEGWKNTGKNTCPDCRASITDEMIDLDNLCEYSISILFSNTDTIIEAFLDELGIRLANLDTLVLDAH